MGTATTDGVGTAQLSLFDSFFNGMGASEMYRAQSFPDLYPHEKAMRISNWSEQDREEYCGGIYTKGYK